ncbi:MAG TPA: HAD-IC family P-type ATPase [Patescibacteria group bacterium]
MKTKELLKTLLRDTSQKNKLNEALETFLQGISSIDQLQKVSEIPFSSDRKYSACIYPDITLVLGAPEVLLAPENKVMDNVKKYTAEALRVVVFGSITGQFEAKKDDIKKHFKPLLVIALEDPIREEAPKILEQLTKEKIGYRIISGDSPDTVTAIARQIIKNEPIKVISGDEIDKLNLSEQEKAILEHNIFARIKPHQKQLIIRVLKKNKLFTIMIGDGVNDVLALKESDLGIAMNTGSAMAKDVADVVLLNNSFTVLPHLLYEGRRIIANIQTIANIYLIKNVSSIAAILMLGFIGLHFPFDPKHVELSSFLVIGLPSFVLAFEKHKFSTTDIGFIKRLLLYSGIIGFGNALIYTIIYIYYDVTSIRLFYARSILLTTVIFMGINNIILIYLQHYSLNEILKRKIVVGLLFTIFIIFLLCLILPDIRTFFAIQNIALSDFILIFCIAALGSMIILKVLRRLNLIQVKEAA